MSTDPTAGHEPYGAGSWPAGPPVSGPPFPGQPGSGQPAIGHPVSGHPAIGQPVSGQPVSGHPVSGHPVSGQPAAAQISGPPQPWNSSWTDQPAPSQNGPGTWQPRIVPSPPAKKGRLWLGLAIGLLAGILVTAPVTWLLVPGAAEPDRPTGPRAPASPARLSTFEQTQQTLNKPKFSGDLLALAEPWLPYVSSCLAHTDGGGPKLGSDESSHVSCRYGGAFVHFAAFKGALERDRSRDYRKGLNADNKALAPGMSDPERTGRASDPTVGTYLEYALRNSEGRTLTGIWWDPEGDRAVGMYIEARWEEVLGGSWEPLRDLWKTRS